MKGDKYIYDFGKITDPIYKAKLGNKGAGLSEMTAMGLSVPPGFTITTDLCQYYYANQKRLPEDFEEELLRAVNRLEIKTGKVFGSVSSHPPLLLSVRSGAAASMPGMMDTILNLGMNDNVVSNLEKSVRDSGFATEIYERFKEGYSKLVGDVTDSPRSQLVAAIRAVLDSWMSERAIAYRSIHNIPDELGTAVNIQSMVFGNMGEVAGTGVLFTRNPSSGKKRIYGEFLPNAQGEDIVSGTRTPYPIFSNNEQEQSMYRLMPEIYNELQEVASLLESHYLDMQDIEFTIEDGKLYILQTRSGKRTSRAAISIAVDMVKTGIITKEEALLRVDAECLNQMLHPRIDENCKVSHVAVGLAASPGAASGIVVLSPYDAEELSHHHKVILVRTDTSPEDISGMYVSDGILTARGGMTSHAAVVARGMGKPCICGATSLKIDAKQGLVHIGGVTVKKGDVITIDGDSGKIFIGEVPTVVPEFTEDFNIFMSWADEIRKLEVRSNAETVLDVETSLRLGAEGVGLCRTEHMFFEPEKIALMREMIVAPTDAHRQIALDKLLPLHKQDFKNIFKAMNGKPVNVRLIDPPLHEFLPSGEKEKLELAKSLNLTLDDIDSRLHALHEVNPMLGHRGCRLGITYPQIYAMQLEALVMAALEVENEFGIKTDLEIMMPLIADKAELANLRTLAENVILTTEDKIGGKVNYKIGTMIELPRACIQAAEIAKIADYFSFGTNDLTQTTYGISRDDVASFLPYYIDKKIIASDPFTSIDKEGVGQLIAMAVERGRAAKGDIKIGVCGEHGGDPSSIDFFSKLGMNYVSCSPYRVPIARLAAAQSVLKT